MERFLRVLGLMLLGIGVLAAGLELYSWPPDRDVVSFSGLAFLGNALFFVVGGVLLFRCNRLALLAMAVGALPLLYSQFLWHHMLFSVGEHTRAEALLAFVVNGAVVARVLPLCVAFIVFALLGRLSFFGHRFGSERSVGST